MSPPPVRVELNARRLPSGENSGRDSVAGCETSRRAVPPAAGTVQMSPPETKAISLPSGEMPGSAKAGRDGGDCARATHVESSRMAHTHTLVFMAHTLT